MIVEKFKADLRALFTLVENLAIHNFVYFDTILEVGGINLPALEERVQEAQNNPARRQQVHEMYAEMWEGLEKSGNAALFEGILEDLPPTDKPN